MQLSKLSAVGGLLSVLSHIASIHGACYDPSPAFPPPNFDAPSPELERAFSRIKASLEQTASAEEYDTSSFSVEVTSSKKTLLALYHTATQRDASRPGAAAVNGSSAYRIASCTKVFTVLALLQQHAQRTLHLDDAVGAHLPELAARQTGTLPWHDITLRALGSQLSGVPSDLFQADVLNELAHPERFGLPPPPASREGLPTCDAYSPVGRPCDREDLLEALRRETPNFAPAQQPSYCNVGFDILGLVLEKVTGMEYSEYIHAMLAELDIDGITFDKPADEIAVLPADQAGYWDVELGVQRPWVAPVLLLSIPYFQETVPLAPFPRATSRSC